MKWFSVKKHKPLMGGEYFITDSEFCYIGEYSPTGKWINPIDDEEIGNITHFCRPDPLEKD
jgi:hypothetical protein